LVDHNFLPTKATRATGPGMSSAPSFHAPQTGKSGVIIRRLLHDYVGGQWGLLLLAIACMLLTSTTSGLLPQLVKLELKQIFTREVSGWLLPLTLAAIGLMAVRATSLFFGRLCQRRSATCSPD
jgi:ABC-type multidrug transport system fused ATPase/permease subunit